MGELRWADYPPFERIEEPVRNGDAPEPDEVLAAIEAEREGGPSIGEYDREWVLAMVETRAQLDRYFDGLPRTDLVVPAIHDLLVARCRTPRRVLEPAEAVGLAREHMGQLVEACDRVLEARAYLPPDILASANWYVDTLRSLDIRWVDRSRATPGAVEFEVAPGRPSPAAALVFGAEDFERSADGRSSRIEVACTALFDPIEHRFRAEVESASAERPAFQWRKEQAVERLVDFGHSPLIDFIFGPLYEGRFDGEPFYRLWEGGASMWIGEDAIEVRTDWAQRWPNSRYLD